MTYTVNPEGVRTFWALTPEELRGLADQCERHSGNYIELVDMDPGMWVRVRLDDEAGGAEFTVDNEGRLIASET
jgi:hypothetical protein